jgi:hypothetical protein
MRHLTSLIIFCCIVTSTDIAGAAAVYRWRDTSGGLHFSNRVEATPEEATEVTLPPLPTRAPSALAMPPAVVAARPAGVRASEARPSRPTRVTEACGAPDPRGVTEAVAARLGARQLDGLTLIVGGTPVAYGSDTRIDVKGPDVDVRTAAPAEQAAMAYPEGSRCPTRPPLERYAVSSGRHAPSRRLCDDYRRAFAQVGVAVSRDQGVARSFREAAEQFVDVARRDYTAGGRDAVVVRRGAFSTLAYVPEERVPLSPWVVEAHIAQTRELDAESSGLVDELSVALEEIDSAARRAGCW